jgi:hypothetical protein
MYILTILPKKNASIDRLAFIFCNLNSIILLALESEPALLSQAHQ